MKNLLAAAAAFAVAFVAVEKSAEAAIVTGAKSYGQTFSRSSYDGDFGASFEAGAKMYANDYAQLCASTKPSLQCAGMSGLFYTTCTTAWTAINKTYCAKAVGNKMGYGAYGGAEADVRIFGKDLSVFDIDADARVEPNDVSTGYAIYAGGYKLSGTRYGAQMAKNVRLAERTLVRASANFMLGPIPVTVSASAVGSLGIDLNLSAGTAKVAATATPYAQVDGIFSAGVGTTLASAGVEGELLLARLGVPGTATVTWNGGKQFGYTAALRLTLETLDGRVSLYGQGFGYKGTLELTSWDGLDWSRDLGTKQGSFSL